MIVPRQIFLLAADAIHRIDPATPAAAPVSTPRAPGLPAADALAEAFAAARLPRNAPVLLLDAEAWCQPIDLPAAQLDGLPPDQLQNLLGLEAEAFSAIPQRTSRIAWTLSPEHDGSRTARILQLAAADCDALAAAARRARLRLLGISHPAFLLPDAPAWDPAAAAAAWRARDPSAAFPLVPPPPPPDSPRRNAAVAAALLAAVLAAAGIHWLAASAALRSATAEHDLRSARQAQSLALQRDLKTIRDSTAALRTRLDNARNAAARLDAARDACPALLRALADSLPSEVLVQTLDSPAPFALEVRGLAAAVPPYHDALLALSRSLPPAVHLVPGDLTALHRLGNGGPWTFAFQLLPAEDAP